MMMTASTQLHRVQQQVLHSYIMLRCLILNKHHLDLGLEEVVVEVGACSPASHCDDQTCLEQLEVQLLKVKVLRSNK